MTNTTQKTNKPTKKERQQVLLSILVPTLVTRRGYFQRVSRVLNKQIKEGYEGKVEILAYEDNREKSTGYKRNVLLKKAKGKFSVFVDDDDMVATFYVAEIVNAIENNPDIDAIGIQGWYSENGGKKEPFETSLKHHWEKKGDWYYRTINHISPIKTELARQVAFPDKVRYEDYEWTIAEPQDIGDKWYFDFTFKHEGELPEDKWESFAGAPGVTVDKNTGRAETVSWEEYQKCMEIDK